MQKESMLNDPIKIKLAEYASKITVFVVVYKSTNESDQKFLQRAMCVLTAVKGRSGFVLGDKNKMDKLEEIIRPFQPCEIVAKNWSKRE